MTDTTNPTQEPAPKGHHHDELAEVKQLIETYGKPAVTALLVVMIGIFVFQMYTTRKEKHLAESTRQLAAARSIPDFEAVYANFSKTKAAPRALLAVAKLYYDNANYEIASAKYDEFLREFPDDRMTTTAELGRIFCLEARNYNTAIEEAAEAFAAFAKANADSFLAPQAIFGQARCFEQLGKLDEARAIYEDFIAKQTGSPWSIRAEDLLEQVVLQIEKQQAAGSAPVEAAAIPAIEIPAVVDEATTDADGGK
jgi:tetratricopeptide (TPR) repeat protein